MIKFPMFKTIALQYVSYANTAPKAPFLAPISEKNSTMLSRMSIICSQVSQWILPSRAMMLDPLYSFKGAPIVFIVELRLGTTIAYEYPDNSYNTSRLHRIFVHLGCSEFIIDILFNVISFTNFHFGEKSFPWLRYLFKLLAEYSTRHYSQDNRFLKPSYLRLEDD